ncbi:MAG: hypothetical protein ABSG98_04480 [Anaerolineales bacterium]|jgi:hypothetical protein
MSIFFYVAFLLVLLFPSANFQLFDGFPLSRLAEFAAFFLIIPFLIWGDLRQKVGDWLVRCHLQPWYLWGGLVLAFAIKLVLFASGTYQGFLGCYRSPAVPVSSYRGPTVNLPCERSYENPLLRFGVTRVDAQINFAPDNWNLAFINSARYDYYDWEPGNILRDRMPLEAIWTGTIVATPGERMVVNYVGSGEISVGAEQLVLTPSYQREAHVTLPLPVGASTLRASYRFDDGSRSGQNPSKWGPRATFALLEDHSGNQASLAPAAPALGARVVAGGSDAVLAIGLLLLVLVLGQSLGTDLLALGAVGVAIGIIFSLPMGQSISELALVAVLAAVLLVHWRVRRLSPLLLYGSVIAVSVALIRGAYPTWNWVVNRTAGNDGLLYESVAQSLWLNYFRPGTIQFGTTPYFPYVVLLEHFLFGDGDVFCAIVLLAVVLGGVFFVWDKLAPPANHGWRSLTAFVVAVALLICTGYYAAGVIRDGLSEPPGWALGLWCLPPLLYSSDRTRFSLGLVGLASTFGIRTNWFLGVLALEALATYRAVRARGLRPWIGLGLAGILMVVPFWWVVTQPQLAINEVLGPASVPLLLRGNYRTWLTLLNQLRYIFFAVKFSESLLPVAVASHLLLLAWAGSLLVTVRRKSWLLVLLAVSPALYLLPYVALTVVTYFPRHVMTGYLAMGVVTIALLGGHLDLEAMRPPL